MPSGKRAHEVIDLSDSDTAIKSHVHASKAPRRSGTHDDPIRFSDSESEDEGEGDGYHHLGQFQLPENSTDSNNRQPDTAQVVRRPAPQAGPANEMASPLDKFGDVDFSGYWNDDAVFYDADDEFGLFPALAPNDDNLGGIFFKNAQNTGRGPRLYARHGHQIRQQSSVPLPENVTEDECITRVIELFPDIAHDYVVKIHKECQGKIRSILDKIIDEPTYPKERDRKGKGKEKRESSIEVEKRLFTHQDRDLARGKMRKAILEILKNEFPQIPVYYIDQVQSVETHLYPAYMTLVKTQYLPKLPYPPASQRNIREIDFPTIVRTYGPVSLPLETELAAARKARAKFEAKCCEEEAHRREEKENIERAKAEGSIAECATCFDESPLNRMISCNAVSRHFTCFECATTYIASEVGQSRSRLVCPDSSGCAGGFTELQLRLIPDRDLVEKLLKLQQEQDVRDAGVDDVVECPFCDYKQVCPPVDVDFEFRCQKPDCSITSCRKCQQHTHIPLTCEEVAKRKSKDTALEQRHTIEEAMTAALIRNCNRCKKPFIKDYGCNKMTCPSCGNLQCYVCSKTVTNYNHFHDSDGCPLHDNVEERHAQDVEKAEAAARAKVEAENPLVSKEDLDFQLSERVKKDEEAAEARRRQLAAAGGGGHAGIANYAAIFGHVDLENEAARAQRDMAMVRQQQALQRNLELQRAVMLRQMAEAQPAQVAGAGPAPAAAAANAHDVRVQHERRLARLREMEDIARRQHALRHQRNGAADPGPAPAPPAGAVNAHDVRVHEVRHLVRIREMEAVAIQEHVRRHQREIEDIARRRPALRNQLDGAVEQDLRLRLAGLNGAADPFAARRHAINPGDLNIAPRVRGHDVRPPNPLRRPNQRHQPRLRNVDQDEYLLGLIRQAAPDLVNTLARVVGPPAGIQARHRPVAEPGRAVPLAAARARDRPAIGPRMDGQAQQPHMNLPAHLTAIPHDGAHPAPDEYERFLGIDNERVLTNVRDRHENERRRGPDEQYGLNEDRLGLF